MIIMISITLSHIMLRMLIPVGFLIAGVLFILIAPTLFSLILIFCFNLEDSNLFIASGLVGFRVYYKMVTLS